MRFKSVCVVLLAIGFLLTMTLGAGAATFKIKIAHVDTPQSPNHLAFQVFKKLAEERSNGRIQVSIHPGSALGTQRESVESAQMGSIELRDAHSSFDRVASARRQPGSVFKPLVALAAFSAERESPLTLATVLEDRPLELEVEGRTWAPRNYERTFRGAVTLRDALADSLNVPFARLGMEAGLVHVAETARRFGITTPLRPVPSLSLGAFEVTPLEMTAAYGALAAGGQRAEPRAILAVVSPGGEVLGGERVLRERVARAEHAWLVTSALRSAVDRGTGRTLRSLGVDGPVAGKTGTTNGARDAWFVGMTPDLVIGVWVGFDDGARVGLTGAQAALPIFARFLRTARGQGGWQDFEATGGIVTAAIDPTSGLGAGPGCGGREEHFVRGTVPREHCGGASSLGHRLRGLLPW